MTSGDDNLGELIDLVHRVCNGQATSGDVARLDQLLAASDAAVQCYVECLDTESQLLCQPAAEAVGGTEGSGFRVQGSEPVVSGQWSVVRNSETVYPGLPSTIHYPLSTALGHVSQGWALAYLVATVVLGMGLLVGAFTHVSEPSQVARQPASLPSPASGRGAGGEGGGTLPCAVGRITGMVDCQFGEGSGLGTRVSGLGGQGSELPSPAGRGAGGEGSSSPKTQDPRPKALVSLGDRFALASGLLEITYDTGAKVILQGPVTYEVESRGGGFLSVGKLTAKVEKKVAGGQWPVASEKSEIRSPKSEISNPQSLIPNPSLSTLHSPLFTIRTPTALVTDLGTEFGVEVARSGNTTSHVFRGSVRVQRTGADGSVEADGRVVRENQTVRVESSHGDRQIVILHTFAPSYFVREFPARAMPAKSDAGDAHAKLVLSLKPVVYYRMEPPQEEKQRGLVVDASGGGHDGILTFSEGYNGSPYAAGRFGRCLRLRGPAVGDHAIVPDYPKATDDRLTVSAWVMAASRSSWAMIAANLGHNADGSKCRGQFSLGMSETDGDLSVGITQRNGTWTTVREGPAHPLPLGVWQHVAFVIDGSVAHLYRNGVQVASGQVANLLPHPSIASLGIGCITNTAGTDVAHDSPRFWLGRIDELAIFNRALSAAEIKSLSTVGNGSTPGVHDSTDSSATKNLLQKGE